MAKKFWVLFAVMVLSVNLAYAVEGNTKKSVSPAPPKLVKDPTKESVSPAPPKLVKDPTTGIEMLYVKGGCYKMGNTFGDGGPEEKPVHDVCVGDFYMGKYEVTQGQWKKIIGSNSSNNSSCGDDCPVDKVSWNDAQDFISKLNSRSGGGKKSSSKYRLPTEAEWEYAARSGGKSEKYSGNDDVNGVSWYADNSVDIRFEIRPVGLKAPNGLGIYDMSGNVWEWTNDWYGNTYYSSSPRNNPTGPSSGDRRVLRGGSFGDIHFDVRTSYRNYLSPDYRGVGKGFRLLMTAPIQVR